MDLACKLKTAERSDATAPQRDADSASTEFNTPRLEQFDVSGNHFKHVWTAGMGGRGVYLETVAWFQGHCGR